MVWYDCILSSMNKLIRWIIKFKYCYPVLPVFVLFICSVSRSASPLVGRSGITRGAQPYPSTSIPTSPTLLLPMPTPLLGKSDLLRFERVGLETHPPLVVNMMAVCKIKIDQFILLFKPCTNPQVSVSVIIMHFKISISLKIFTRYDRLQRACSTYKLLQIVWTIRYLKT